MCHADSQVYNDAPSCTVYCTYSEAAHASQPDTMLGEEAYSEYRAALLEASNS